MRQPQAKGAVCARGCAVELVRRVGAGDTRPMAVVRENTRTGMRYAWRDPQADDGILRADFWLAPGKPGALDHINPSFAEHVTVLAGEAHFRLGDRRWRVAAGEETVVLPAGIVHNFTNPTSSELHVYVELHPG